jgi:hypothetical protein
MPPGANCCLLKVLLILSPFVGALSFWNQRVKLSLRGGARSAVVGCTPIASCQKLPYTYEQLVSCGGMLQASLKPFKPALGNWEGLIAEHSS